MDKTELRESHRAALNAFERLRDIGADGLMLVDHGEYTQAEGLLPELDTIYNQLTDELGYLSNTNEREGR